MEGLIRTSGIILFVAGVAACFAADEPASVTEIEQNRNERITAFEKRVTQEQTDRIEAALPDKPMVKPKRPKKLLIIDLNTRYGGHGSIPYANIALKRMGEKTGAYEAVIRHDISAFNPDNLKQFDAVFLNNTVLWGEAINRLFKEQGYGQSLLDFVKNGGGLAANHGASASLPQWPEYGRLIGGCLDGHPWNEEVAVRVEEPEHPINMCFEEKTFKIKEEIYQFKEPYSRDGLRVLLSLDTNRTDMNKAGIRRQDNDFAVSWVHSYGKGKVFYCSLGHYPEIFWDPEILRHFLAGIQFVLGDLQADASPKH